MIASRSRLALVTLLAACGPLPMPIDAGPIDAGQDAFVAPRRDANGVDAFVPPAMHALCAPVIGLSRDMLPLARLDADLTRPISATSSVVREDLDGPATIRDDVASTGWAPVPDVIATLRMDLGSGVGRPIALDALTMTTSGAPLTDVHVAVYEVCGGAVTGDFAWDDVMLPLPLAGTCGTCVELAVRGGPDSRVLSIALQSRDTSVDMPPIVRAAAPMPTSESGVIEGFYGPPWSFAERARMIDAASRLGLGTYLYAPKYDPLHLTEWRVPYDAAAIARFASLASIARARHVRFFFGVSPFVDFRPGVEADYVALVAKLRTMLDAGAGGVALLADDIGFDITRIDGSLGAFHASVVTRIASELAASHPDAAIWFVPTIYDDQALAVAPYGGDYLMALRALPTGVRVLWTGRDTASATLVGTDLDHVRALIAREPLIWDNAWANDPGGSAGDHLLFGTYEGRDPALRDAAYGIAANPLVQGSLARLPIALLGAWLARGETGIAARDSAASAEERFTWRSDVSTHDTLVRLMEAYEGTFVAPATHRALAAALARMTAAVHGGGAPDATDLSLALDVFAGFATLRSAVRNGALDADMGDELEAPLASLEEDGRTGLALLDAIMARISGRDAAAAIASAREHAETSLAASRFVWSPGLLGAAIETIATAPSNDHGARGPAANTIGTVSCVVGAPLALSAFGSGVVRAYGLPGATVGGDVRFVAPHPGIYTAVLTGRDPSSGGVASISLEIGCVPAR